jgi:hypothetical protein
MRRTALSIAALLGIATLGGAIEARAMPTVAATVTIENDSKILVTGKRHRHHGFHSGRGFHRHSGRGFHRDLAFARHHHGFGRGRAFHKSFAHRHAFARFSRGHRHANAFIAKRIGKSQFVIIRPAYGRSFGYRFLPARPLIKNGSFARRSHYW